MVTEVDEVVRHVLCEVVGDGKKNIFRFKNYFVLYVGVQKWQKFDR